MSVQGAIATVYQMHEGVKSVSVKSKYFEWALVKKTEHKILVED